MGFSVCRCHVLTTKLISKAVSRKYRFRAHLSVQVSIEHAELSLSHSSFLIHNHIYTILQTSDLTLFFLPISRESRHTGSRNHGRRHSC